MRGKGAALALVDAHVHLPEYPDPAGVIRDAKARDMRLLSCTVAPHQFVQNLSLAEESAGTVRAFLGVHPSDASELLPTDPKALFGDMLQRCDGIGEIGLDPNYSPVGGGSAQFTCFTAQLAAAETTGKPVQVHSRNGERACIDALGSYNLTSVLMHWFEGKEEGAVRQVVSRGYYVTFGPSILYSKRAQRLARIIPRERVLVESDGPVRFEPLGGAGGPNTIASVLFQLAGLMGMSFLETESCVEANALAYLGHRAGW